MQTMVEMQKPLNFGDEELLATKRAHQVRSQANETRANAKLSQAKVIV